MRALTLFLVIFSIFCGTNAHAQDKIYKTDGEVINAKVKQVDISSITYKRYDNQDGPVYTIDKSDVSKIKYENGTMDKFDANDDDYRRMPPYMPQPPFMRRRRHDTTVYAKNILSVTPFSVANDDVQGGFGIGINYERVLDKNGYISFYLPVIVNFDQENDNSYYGPTTANTKYAATYIMPGIKFYPTSNQGKVKYAIGPNLFFSTGTNQNDQYLYNGNGQYGYYSSYTSNYQVYGILLNNYLNISPTPHLYIALELGLGFRYFSTNANVGIDSGPLAQFSFKVGYRF